MEVFFAGYREVLSVIIELIIMAIEIFGVCYIVYIVIRSIILMLRKKEKVSLEFCKGMSFILQLLMASELLATLCAFDLERLAILSGIVAIRLVFALVLIKEIKTETERLKSNDQTDSTIIHIDNTIINEDDDNKKD